MQGNAATLHDNRYRLAGPPCRGGGVRSIADVLAELLDRYSTALPEGCPTLGREASAPGPLVDAGVKS